MLGDGIRRNIATVSQEERDLFLDAVKQLNQIFYSPGGSRSDFPAGHVSYWFKQDEIHQSTHVHHCPQFLPWHRAMVDRFEALLRGVHPELSLHYWDWNFDPTNMPADDGTFVNLFAPDFFGNADANVNGGAVGDPLLSAGFYDPTPVGSEYRDDGFHVLNKPDPNNPSTWSYAAHANPADPPIELTRGKVAGAPPIGQWLADPLAQVAAAPDWSIVAAGSSPPALYWPRDDEFVSAGSWEQFNDVMQGFELGSSQNAAHALAHSYIGGASGTITNPHTSFRDPFVFLLHSNIDRLWAMWQRASNPASRLDPAQVYDTQENTQGSGDVEFGEPQWGILSPLEPWAGLNAQTAATGIIANVIPVRPWFAPENEQNVPENQQDAKSLSVVIPASYDTALHSSYVVANQEIFSSAQAAANATFARAIYLIYDGFQPREVGGGGAAQPTVSFSIAGAPVASITAVNQQVWFENPGSSQDVPQRIAISCDLSFGDLSVFPAAGETALEMNVDLAYTVGGTTVQAHERTAATLFLVSQPSPYLIDIDPDLPPPGPPNPYWLSADTRVFQLREGDSLAGHMQGTDPIGFITNLATAFTGLPNDSNHPFHTALTQDENASQLELSPTSGGMPVYNYAIAKIRYRGDVPANNISVFFRLFKTVVSALDYDHTSGAVGNYRRSGNTLGATPLLGIQSNEIASIPFFAHTRVDPTTQSMTAQPDDPINHQISFLGTGQEEITHCGVWLDINDGTPRFPFDPSADPNGPNGPFTSPLHTIEELVAGFHYCMVAEIFYWPPGTASDPIPASSTPASSDRLAQRNIAFDNSGNPGWPETHTVEHTFLVKPSLAPELSRSTRSRKQRTQAGDGEGDPAEGNFELGPDELMIDWGNVPRATQVTLFFPEIEADEILRLAALRQRPDVLSKVDEHTIALRVAEASYLPLPGRAEGNLAGLITLRLPDGIRVGQVFKLNVQQISGLSIRGRARKTIGAFQFTISVTGDTHLLPATIRKLSILRFVRAALPAGSRWEPIFERWLASLERKVRGLGGNPDAVQPSPSGGDQPNADRGHPHRHHPRRPRRDDDDRCCKPNVLNIPWEDCDAEGELELKLRFRHRDDDC